MKIWKTQKITELPCDFKKNLYKKWCKFYSYLKTSTLIVKLPIEPWQRLGKVSTKRICMIVVVFGVLSTVGNKGRVSIRLTRPNKILLLKVHSRLSYFYLKANREYLTLLTLIQLHKYSV